MDFNQALLMYQRLSEHVPVLGNKDRVFRVFFNPPGGLLWMSRPPVGSLDFAKLAEEVVLNTTLRGGKDGASCTRRYKAMQLMHAPRGLQTG